MDNFNNLESEELMAICSAISIYLSKGKTPSEINVLSSMAFSVANLLSLASSQKKLFNERNNSN